MLNNKNIRSYKKESKQLEIKYVEKIRPSEIPQVDNIRSAKEIVLNGRNYSKPLEGTREYYLIIIITEDAKRTPQYFEPLINQNIRGIMIKTVANKKGGTPPSHMGQEAEACETNYGLDYNSGDELYLICDLDHYRIQLENLYKTKKSDWKLIISNPCIEIWFYYHYKNTRPDFPPYKNEKDNSKHMKQICNTVKNGGIDHSLLLRNIDINIPITNSKNVYELEEGSSCIPILGSTQMFHLIDRLRDIISDIN